MVKWPIHKVWRK